MVEDLIHKLEWQAFWTHNDKATYPVLEKMKELQNMLVANERCSEQFDVINRQMEQMHQDFLEFQKECEAKSELCQFFGVWLQLVSIVKNAEVSDREGNWSLHVATIEDSMQIFAGYDCINFLRYGSWYLAQIKIIKFTHPKLYWRFSIGQWVVFGSPRLVLKCCR
ncbi:hypothetical protein DPMN_012992 [Dreissena polymorpha]|uniref:Uncharacterized protein n=1 Tax=Dreissena polymorpha TaxID=45954 RepID=A0A9D4S3W0_DREPO|nr:hypothetical protein DPMN_012992 [Dreissena polymorpha]